MNMAGSDVTGSIWDVIVVGAGVVGSSAAYHLAKDGFKTLLLEQFPLPHTRGSSSGQSRIIRNAYEIECYAAMMNDAFKQWQHLEEETGINVLKQTGLLFVEGGEKHILNTTKSIMIKCGLPNKELSPSELRHNYPFFEYPDDHHALLDVTAGILIPNRCLIALQTVFKRHGGHIQDGVQVVNMKPGDFIEVLTNQGTYKCRNLVLCPGPWAGNLFSQLGLNLPLKPMPGVHAYWKVKDPSKWDAATKLPIIDHQMATPQGYWLVVAFPAMEYPGMMKVAMRREPSHRYCHPDERDAESDDVMIRQLTNYVQSYIPGLEAKPCIREACMYTMTPDRDYVVDRHPNHKNILLAAGMSGHGFKLGPVVGQILSWMIQDKKIPYDISCLSVKRFLHQAKL